MYSLSVPPSLLLALLLITAPGLRAQSIHGELVEQGTGHPVDGGIVTLLDARDAQLGGTLTDADGRFTLRLPAPGRYRLRAERIGYTTTTSPWIEIAAGETLEYRLEASTLPVSLEGVVAQGERRCRIRPEEGLLTARLWNEARKALSAATLTSEQRLVQFEMLEYERELDARTMRVVTERTRHRAGWSESPFRSAPPEWLADHGFIQTDPDSITWFAPDARALLSDPFLDTHCFHAEPGEDANEGMIGLAFQPIPGRGVPEIRGVLWLDEATAELRYLEYGYLNTGLDVPMDRVGGRVEFRRLSSGAWIVERWWIRMPMVGVRIARSTGEPSREHTLIGFKEDGGEVTSISTGEVAVFDAPEAVLVGTVFDSTRTTPLAGATVFLSGTSYSATTNTDGRFRLEGLPDGTFAVSFMHPRLDSLRIVPPSREVTLSRGNETSTDLAIPSNPPSDDGEP